MAGMPGVPYGAATMVDNEATAQTWETLKKRIPEVNFEGVPLGDVLDFLRDVSGLNIHVNWREMEAAGIPRTEPVTLRAKNLPAWQALKMVLADVSKGLQFEVEGGLVTITAYEAAQQELVTKAYEVRDLLELGEIGKPDVSSDPRMLKLNEDLRTETQGLAALRQQHGEQNPKVVEAKARLELLQKDMAAFRKELEGMAAPNQAQTMRELREEKIGQLVNILTSTVAPDSWRDAGGNLGTIRGFNTKLIISTTEANHREVEKVLQMIRAK